jgi:ADP-ribose pyrophosphatase
MAIEFPFDELVYRGRVADVHRVGVRGPGGRLLARDFFHYGGAVVILPVLADGRIVLIRNFRYPIGERLWELPAGMLESGEAPAAGAARELLEETGYAAGHLAELGRFYTAPGTSDELMHAYLATDLAPGPQHLEPYEEITAEALAADQVRQMASDGRIRDAKTLSALGLYWLQG